MNKKLFKYIYFGWILVFVILPFALVLFQSFLDYDNNMTLQNYKDFFTPIYLQMTFNSFLIALIVTLITLIFGFTLAFVISKSKHQKLLLMFIVIPSWINLLLKTYSFMAIFGSYSPLNIFLEYIKLPPLDLLYSIQGFLVVVVYIYIPFMTLPIYHSMKSIKKIHYDAASDLGANEWQKFIKITLPMSKQGIYSGIQIVFIPTLSIFMITRLIAGNQIITLGTAVEQHFLVTNNWGLGSAIGTILIVILVIFIYTNKFFNKDGD